ncbi:MAG: methyltransferase domain-containing protein [Bryobacteraceae bacterium]
MAEFTGERVIPGQVDADLLNEHMARYAFAARLSRRKQVLDAGCGAGYGSAELAKYAATVLGIDYSADAVEYARAEYAVPNLRFEQADCAALPAADGSIDLVVAFEVIEHLEDWRGFLSEARRVLAPGGQFIVSTPNKLYYAETRRDAGANPFHVHEFEFEEFRSELSAVFSHVSLFLENHTEGVVFQPLDPDTSADVRVDGEPHSPAESHFFVAVCAQRPQTGAPTFVYLPRTGNVLREREKHIELLASEVAFKTEWLEKATAELSTLNEDHQRVLAMLRCQARELEERTAWAEGLQRDLNDAGARVIALQEEIAAEQTASRELAAAYEVKVLELDRENSAKTEWALETEARLGKELDARGIELTRCVELLHQAEATLEERTRWAQKLDVESGDLRRQLDALRGSIWVRIGRRLGMSPGTS